MAVRKLKSNQKRRCSWCGCWATHRGYGFGKTACPDHISSLIEWDKKESAPDYSDAAFYGGY